MDIQSAASIMTRMKEDYASVHAAGGKNARDRLGQQEADLTAHAQEHGGLAVTIRELDYGPAAKFPLADLGSELARGNGSSAAVLQAYGTGASIAAKPEYGGIRLARQGEFAAKANMLTSPDTERDETLQASADALARDLQKARDQEAVRSDIVDIFQQNGIPETSLFQMKFDQQQDGSISVTNHPLAAHVESLVNSDRGLADMLSFSFSFNGRTNVMA